MAFKTLLTHVESTVESDLRVQAAIGLAQRWSAALIGVGGNGAFLAAPLVEASAGGSAVQAWAQDERVLCAAASRFGAAAASLGERAVWQARAPAPDREMSAMAAGADLVLVSLPGGPIYGTASPVRMIFDAGTPVLALPAGVGEVRTDRILVAWTDTREARRAVADAIPLLKAAQEVVLLTARPHDSGAAADTLRALEARLARHGIGTTVKVVSNRHERDAAIVLGFAEAHRSDLIVAGAYGHARALEWCFGGVTQALLEESPAPVFFSR